MQYMSNEPFKLLRRASIQKQKINKRLDQYTQNFTQLRALAAYQQQSVKQAIEKNKDLNDNFRKLEYQDEKKRNQIMEKLQKTTIENTIKRQKLLEERKEKVKKKNENVEKVCLQHIKDDLDKERAEEVEAMKVRKERVKEIEEKERQKVNFKRRRGSYDQAVERIRRRDQLIQQFAQDTNDRIDNSFKRNSKKMNPEHQEARLDKLKKYLKVLKQQKILLSLRTNRCIQHHCSNLEAADQMNTYKRTQWDLLSQTIQKFNKSHSERAQGNKKQIDEEEKVIPEKCEHRLNHSVGGMEKEARETRQSSFMITSKTWRSEGKNKREYMRSIQESRNEDIIGKHLSTTFRNKGEVRIQNKFLDLNRKASFNAKEFL